MKNRFYGEVQPSPFAYLAGSWRSSAHYLRRLGAYLTTARDKPSWIIMFVFSRVLVARAVRQRLYRSQPTKIAEKNTVFPQLEVQSFVAEMKRHGLARGLVLPPSVVDEIREFSATAPCYGNSDPEKPLFLWETDLTKSVDGYVIADYQDNIINCPAIKQLWADPVLLGIAHGYMDMGPHLLRSRLWWSFVAPGADPSQRADFSQAFHFDLDDWMCCKFFFYITETTAADGPHEYVRNSHRQRPLAMQLSAFKGQSEATIHRVYGQDSVETLTGPAGFGFVEDPFGIHRGTQPRGQARLILEVEYGCTPRQPVAGKYGALRH